MPIRLSSRYKHKARERGKEVSVEVVPDWAIEAQNDLGKFGEHVANKIPAPHHREWFQYLCDDSIGYLSILAPRGSAKSTWLALFAAWHLGKHPDAQIIYLGYSEQVALKQSRIIKRLVESPLYQQVFSHIRPGKRWSDQAWEIDKLYAKVSAIDSDASFYAVGITGSITSRRSSLILCDDLIRSSASIASEDVRDKIQTNWFEVIEPTLIPGGRVISVGTRFRRDDIHSTHFNEDNGWRVIEQAAIVTPGPHGAEESYWPERFTMEFLNRLRSRNPHTFLYQFQNRLPALGEDAIIRPEWIKYGDMPRKCDQLVLGVDLAASEKERGDYTALVLIGKLGDCFYVIHAERFKAAGNADKIKRILELRKIYGDFRIAVERVAYQASFIGDFKTEMKRRRIYNFVCEEMVPKGDKLARLEGVSGVFANGFVFLNRLQPMQTLVDELLLIGEHDDLSDAFVLAMSRLLKRARRPVSSA